VEGERGVFLSEMRAIASRMRLVTALRVRSLTSAALRGWLSIWSSTDRLGTKKIKAGARIRTADLTN
jgi:hypothetical protein